MQIDLTSVPFESLTSLSHNGVKLYFDCTKQTDRVVMLISAFQGKLPAEVRILGKGEVQSVVISGQLASVNRRQEGQSDYLLFIFQDNPKVKWS